MGRSKHRSRSIGQKRHNTRKECSQTTDTQLFSTSREDNPEISQVSCAKIASLKQLNDSAIKTENPLFPQKLVENVQTSNAAERSKNEFFNKDCGDGLDIVATASLPQDESSRSAFQFSKLVEEISWRIENLPFLQKSSPFITYAVATAEFDQLLYRTKFTKETTVNDFSTCERDPNDFFKKPPASIDRNFDSGIINGDKEIRFENQFHSSIKNEEIGIESESFPSKRRLEEIARELAAINPTNSGQAENQHFQIISSVHDISLKSRQLCSEMHLNSQNFAKRLLFHIKFLNAIPNAKPPYYLNINVKKIVEYAWVDVKDDVINQTNGKKINLQTCRQMMADCPKSWNQKKSFDLFRFLSYCVIICQIGVQAIKCKAKKIPTNVITFLSSEIDAVDNVLHSCFECNVENIADNIVNSRRL